MNHFRRITTHLILISLLSVIFVSGRLTISAAQTQKPVVDIGFRPAVDGFGFENYGNDVAPHNLTVAEMRRLLGDLVCATKPSDTCTLTPPAKGWMDKINADMNGGHCDGMATLSLMFYIKNEKVGDYGADKTAALQLNGNDKLQREIAYWFATQYLQPTSDAEVKGKAPSDILDMLISGMKKGVSIDSSFVMGIYKENFKEGHAVTPYAVVDRGNDVFWLMVYDNNFPKEERHIEIDRKANTWVYYASTSPDVPESEYRGDAQTGTLTFSPNTARLQPKVCPFCGDSESSKAPGMALAVQKYNEIWSEGHADLLITDASGKRLGYENGKLYTEIPGSSFIASKSADLWANDVPTVYRIPQGIAFTITVDGTKLKRDETTDVAMIGPGYDLAVDSIKLSPGQKDTVKFSPDGTKLAYKSSQTEAPNIVLGVTHTGADWSFDVQGVEIDAGGTINTALDNGKGQLILSTSDTKQPAHFSLLINRIEGETDQEFSHDNIELLPGDTAYIDYGKWAGNGSEMTIQIDHGSVGNISETLTEADQK